MTSTADLRTSPPPTQRGSATADLSSLGRHQVRALFATLTAPDVASMAGRWRGELVGSRWLRWTAVAAAATTPLRHWCGKEVHASGEVHNLVRRGAAVQLSVAGWASAGTSLLDGRPAVVVDYSRTARPPVRWLRGEIRSLPAKDEVFGVLLFPLGRRALGPFPFHMVREREC